MRANSPKQRCPALRYYFVGTVEIPIFYVHLSSPISTSVIS